MKAWRARILSLVLLADILPLLLISCASQQTMVGRLAVVNDWPNRPIIVLAYYRENVRIHAADSHLEKLRELDGKIVEIEYSKLYTDWLGETIAVNSFKEIKSVH